jgi:hypothetical protein
MNITGDTSPHEDDVVETNGRLDPQKSSFVKVKSHQKFLLLKGNLYQ